MRPVKLLVASQNPGKLREMRALVDGLGLEVLSPADVGLLESPPETGDTFLANAILKARYYAGRAGLPTVADDSGLSVDALDGRPGLYSSRFGGPGADDQERNRLLLEMLRAVPNAKRGAHFTSALALVEADVVVFEAVETVHGLITEEPSGAGGFGYDPVFFYPPYGRTLGEVSRAEKDLVSHRGKAFARLREFLLGRWRSTHA